MELPIVFFKRKITGHTYIHDLNRSFQYNKPVYKAISDVDKAAYRLTVRYVKENDSLLTAGICSLTLATAGYAMKYSAALSELPSKAFTTIAAGILTIGVCKLASSAFNIYKEDKRIAGLIEKLPEDIKQEIEKRIDSPTFSIDAIKALRRTRAGNALVPKHIDLAKQRAECGIGG